MGSTSRSKSAYFTLIVSVWVRGTGRDGAGVVDVVRAHSGGGAEPGAALLPIGAALIVSGIYLVNRAPADEKLGRR